MGITISLCMIVKNEEDSIVNCLDSVKDIVDEIIIVDTGSVDDTKAICSQYTDKIFDFEWIDDFAAARNFSFSKATMHYILWLDADDILLNEDREKFHRLKKTLDTSVDSVFMYYNVAKDEHNNVTLSSRRHRLVKRKNCFQWIGPVHEYLAVSGNILDCDIAITHNKIKPHDSNRNLNIYQKRLAKGEKFTPRDLYYYANELSDHKKYREAVKFYEKFLATDQGWVEDNISACGHLADCYEDLGNQRKALKYIFHSFDYDTPRAEFCCRLGWHFMQAEKFKQAAFWYKLATELEKPTNGGFVNHACWSWLPHLQLCVCYDRLGQYDLANNHNEFAAQFIPDDPKINHNRNYFAALI